MSEINTSAIEEVVAPPTDYQLLYEESRAENERLGKVLQAARLGNTPSASHPQQDAKPAVTAERFKALVGPVQFLKMTRFEKLVGLGLDPATVDDEYLRKVFGRGADGKYGQELFKTNRLRYRELKNAADILDIYGR
jgi:hypothetical protein